LTPTVVTLSVPARSEYLALCRLSLAGLGSVRALGDEELADLKLALTEACANVVRHAYDDGDEGRIAVSYRVAGDEMLEIVVADEGRGIPDEGDRPPSDGLGLGLRLIQSLTDELEIGHGDDGRGTVVRMIRRLTPTTPA
jgi:serine/threonine-protein kinase RsbW